MCTESCGLQWNVAEALMTFRLRLQAVSLALHFLGVPHDSGDSWDPQGASHVTRHCYVRVAT